MKTKIIIFLFLTYVSFAYAQADWNTLGNTPVVGNFFGTTNNQPILTQTNGGNRMKLNHNILYTVNAGTSVNRTGNLLIGRENNVMFQSYDLYNANRGAFSLLHLNGDGTEIQEFGYRNWMQTGITFTGNRDLSYFGLRKLPPLLQPQQLLLQQS